LVLEQMALAAALVAALAPWRALPQPPSLEPTFLTAERAVDNWRREAAFALDLPAERAAALLLGREIGGMSRCVRLNNYWCVKKAGWTGEIASDAEGHVAFASAADGAAVAAVLLRRYYLDFDLRTARAIVQRWAPAQCGPTVAALPGPARRAATRSMGVRNLLGPEPKGLTTRGLGNTLRAKWLARHGHGRVSRAKIRRSVVAERPTPMLATPTVAAGFSEAPRAGPPVRMAMLPFPGMALGPDPGAKVLPALPPPPATGCASETQRIANYATAIAQGIAAGPDADLALFDAQGRPTPAFAQALVNMAAVEIGPLRATRELVERAVEAVGKR
jgi:hypothetical protein